MAKHIIKVSVHDIETPNYKLLWVHNTSASAAWIIKRMSDGHITPCVKETEALQTYQGLMLLFRKSAESFDEVCARCVYSAEGVDHG